MTGGVGCFVLPGSSWLSRTWSCFAVVVYLGAWAAHVFGSADWISEVGEHLKTSHHLFLFCLSLYGVYLVLIAAVM